MEIQVDSFDFEAFFHAHYERIARVIARVVGDHGRAEDLAAEALWKLWRTPQVHGQSAGGWLYRTAVRMGLNELRSGRRRLRYEALWDAPPSGLTPEEAHAAAEERDQVRQTLAVLRERGPEPWRSSLPDPGPAASSTSRSCLRAAWSFHSRSC